MFGIARLAAPFRYLRDMSNERPVEATPAPPAMSIGALREAIINATELEGVFGQNIHESKDVLVRVGDQTYPLAEVSVGFDASTGSFVMYLSAEREDATAAITQAILEHAEHMELYSLPATSPGFMEGYFHALGLLRRDAGFIASRVGAAR